jgi:hypothetical protein
MIRAMTQLSVQEAFCSNCEQYHTLSREPAIEAAKDLMARMASELDTDYLYTEARGKMFGVLVCRTLEGNTKTIKAFSGQYDGQWELPGWAPPLFNVQNFKSLNDPVEKKIKSLGREAAEKSSDTASRDNILIQRKQLSRQLMKDIHALYQLHNFKGEQCSLFDLFPQGQGIPTGTGDCCAPKLLNYAALHNLKPLGLAEFYWGKTNRSASRHEGQFYLACEDKCGPILGFLLCGLPDC